MHEETDQTANEKHRPKGLAVAAASSLRLPPEVRLHRRGQGNRGRGDRS